MIQEKRTLPAVPKEKLQRREVMQGSSVAFSISFGNLKVLHANALPLAPLLPTRRSPVPFNRSSHVERTMGQSSTSSSPLWVLSNGWLPPSANSVGISSLDMPVTVASSVGSGCIAHRGDGFLLLPTVQSPCRCCGAAHLQTASTRSAGARPNARARTARG